MNIKINIEDLIVKFRKEVPTVFEEEKDKELHDLQIQVFATWLDSLDIEKVVGNK